MVASCWPAVTAWPSPTRTLVTVPRTGKVASTCETRCTVPVRTRLCETEPSPTETMR